ncbi:MAG TPA: hypothetical protein VH599_17920 [Ktedonobacterales bacterium]|jgi:adenylate kinase family enzyme
MLGIVFALGRPGSGKSTAAHRLAEVAWEKGLSAIRIGDYQILYQMFLKDTRRQRFTPTEKYEGFDVTDFSVLNEALQRLKGEVEQRIKRLRRLDDQLIIIEFARDNYCQALEFFGASLLQKAYYVYINADVQTCIEHIRCRANHPETSDDHYVSEHIMQTYYARDDQSRIQPHLCDEFGISKDHFYMIDNTGSPQEFTGCMKPVINEIICKLSREKFVGERPPNRILQRLFAVAGLL